ncbi:TonB-dependent receptor [Novimethylophilus kurashikiensis]|uniref:TonB-dependent receptor n=1 Tax=Novimethylophilus kurashikiensis TaxID=1825523 RepID=A0A2R5F7F3_9PROT|nr:TonB-dependent receptor [Novimethylophilus kurashikiensis]GBG14146.1 TonB-dependent receptor [Novimethylophilus kurashikiensis]
MDFDYGKPLDDGWRFHVGGFYRFGEGPRTVGYQAEDGGQIKGNITREFDSGYVRLNFKLLNDRAPVYLPVPIRVSGTTSAAHFSSLPSFDVLDGAMQSKYFRHDISVNRNGQAVSTDIADGYYSNSKAFGIEAAFDLAKDWKIEDKFRIASTSGRFVGPYPAEVNTASALATSIGGPGATLRYATGPRAGQVITDPASLNGNGLAVRTHLFNVTLDDLGNFANDLKLTKRFNSGNYGDTNVTLGYFKSQQMINQDWHWNTYLLEVKGKNAALLDVVNSLGQVVTQKGLVAYGEPAWKNCCVHSYKLKYDTDAPYLALGWQQGPINLDGSLRYDVASASGSYAGSTGTKIMDVNGDGVIEPPEQKVPIVDPASKRPVDYTVRYLSYSFGANYLLNPDLAVFGRISRGGRANAERVLFGGGIHADGSIAKEVAVNSVKQVEGGIKWRSSRASLFATLFHATTSVTDQDITSIVNRFTSSEYEADGLELEGSYNLHGFHLFGGLTYTHGTVTRADKNPQSVGYQINPRFMYQLTPAYHIGKLDFGLNFIGLSKFPSVGYGLDNPGYVQVNGFLNYVLEKGWSLSLSGNNLFNRIGITEIPNAGAGVPSTGATTARSINGRTINAALIYSF